MREIKKQQSSKGKDIEKSTFGRIAKRFIEKVQPIIEIVSERPLETKPQGTVYGYLAMVLGAASNHGLHNDARDGMGNIYDFISTVSDIELGHNFERINFVTEDIIGSIATNIVYV